MALPAHSGPRPLIQFHNHFSQSVGLLGRVISPLQGCYLNTGQHKHRINAYTHQMPMPWVWIKTTITASERGNTVHALDRVATVTGWIKMLQVNTIQISQLFSCLWVLKSFHNWHRGLHQYRSRLTHNVLNFSYVRTPMVSEYKVTTF
jgi:hypothetical protein